jgi:hypothetical protein
VQRPPSPFLRKYVPLSGVVRHTLSLSPSTIPSLTQPYHPILARVPRTAIGSRRHQLDGRQRPPPDQPLPEPNPLPNASSRSPHSRQRSCDPSHRRRQPNHRRSGHINQRHRPPPSCRSSRTPVAFNSNGTRVRRRPSQSPLRRTKEKSALRRAAHPRTATGLHAVVPYQSRAAIRPCAGILKHRGRPWPSRLFCRSNMQNLSRCSSRTRKRQA